MKIAMIYSQAFPKFSDELMSKIKDTAVGAAITEVYQDDFTVEDIIDSDVVFGRLDPQILKSLPNLKWYHLFTAGADGMTDISLYANKSVILTRSSGTYGIPIAEYIIGMMIAVSRRFGFYYEKQREGLWSWGDNQDMLDIYGSTVLVLGLGDIGTEVCRRLSAFNCNIIGIRRNASKPHELVKDVRPLSQLKESLIEADYVIICTPGTEKTTKLFGEEEFKLMKKRAIIVNVGRGSAIDSNALVTALHEGEIAGVGLDVTDPEPLPSDHPLWSAPNILITPHVSPLTPIIVERRAMIFIDLLQRYINGDEMYNKVDFTEGY